MKVIGLTGLPSSGKETVKNCLFELCREKGLRPAHFSFSDEIKREALARGMTESDFSRERLTALVGRMRQEEGAGVLAVRIASRISRTAEPADVCVVEAIRHPAEVEYLRARFQRDFVLGAVVAELRTIAQRLLARRRLDESRSALGSVENAVELLQRELNGTAGGGDFHVGRCIAMADVTIRNDGSLEELRRSVAAAFAALLDCAAPADP